jgi:HD superfamily phosphodiesterase
MKIKNIYKKYNIPTNLQMHQLRVAAVASIICDNLEKKVDKDRVITAALLHDMGNIIKFKLDLFPEFMEPQGLKYWQNEKTKFIEKYGNNEHEATSQIARELCVSKKAQKIINSYGFSNAECTYKNSDLETKIAVYSDFRVTPHTVTSMKDRLLEARKRYVENKNAEFKPEIYDKFTSFWLKIEKQIFSKEKISPDFITNDKVKKMIKKFEEFNIN